MTSLGEQFHDPAGCHLGGRPHLGPCRDRGREAGIALTAMRTLLSQTKTALRLLTVNRVSGPQSPLERPRLPKPHHPGVVDCGEPPYDMNAEPFDDPDHAIMVETLGRISTLLAPWERTGKTTHWVTGPDPTQLVMPKPSADYTDEVGDEMFMGQQAVLAELRGRLAAHLGYDPGTARTVLGIADEYMRELADQEREDDEEDGSGHECRDHDDAADCDEFCNPHC